VLRREPRLAQTPPIGLVDSVRSLGLALWDEDAQRLVSFRRARALARV
jgi:hypothetical protein